MGRHDLQLIANRAEGVVGGVMRACLFFKESKNTVRNFDAVARSAFFKKFENTVHNFDATWGSMTE